jgi:fatty acid kinase fatty acid binding subunit
MTEATGRVAVVTDSTSYLPTDLSGHVTVVPVQVIIGGRCFDEGVDVSPAEVAAALRDWQVVTTSRPSPERFAAAYDAAARAGASAVVSVHLSADMSGTYESAVLAARRADLPVRVVDSRNVAMGLGFAVLAAAECAAAGGDVDAVTAEAEARAAAATTLFYVDTLDFLRRGGRIGAAQAILGQALAVKPILSVVDGRVAPLEKVRTKSKALARLGDLAVERAGNGPVDVAVHHLDAADRAGDLSDRLSTALPDSRLVVSEVGAVVGAHVGPGVVAVVVVPA